MSSNLSLIRKSPTAQDHAIEFLYELLNHSSPSQPSHQQALGYLLTAVINFQLFRKIVG